MDIEIYDLNSVDREKQLFFLSLQQKIIDKVIQFTGLGLPRGSGLYEKCLLTGIDKLPSSNQTIKYI